jgi:hypothetical protein
MAERRSSCGKAVLAQPTLELQATALRHWLIPLLQPLELTSLRHQARRWS